MKRGLAAGIAVIVLAAGLPSALHAEACQPPPGVASTLTREISLERQVPARNVYLRTGHHAVFVDAAVFAAALERRYATNPRPSLDRLRKAVNLATVRDASADLFAVALADPLFLDAIEFAVAAVLEDGNATVIDAWRMLDEEARIVAKVQLHSLRSNGGFEGRAYCTSTGDLILEVHDQYMD